MAVEDATKYLQYVATNQAERGKLLAARAPDIVKAGKAAGYNFTEADIGKVLASPTTISDPLKDGSITVSWH